MPSATVWRKRISSPGSPPHDVEPARRNYILAWIYRVTSSGYVWSHAPILGPAHPAVGAPPPHHLGAALHDPAAPARETLGPSPPPPEPHTGGARPHPSLLRLRQTGL